MNKTTNGQTCFILQGSGFYKHSLDNPNLKCFLVVLFDNLLYHEAARREIRYLRIQRKTLEDLYILGRKLRVVYQELFAKLPWCSFISDSLTGIQHFLRRNSLKWPFIIYNQTNKSIIMQISINKNI